MGCNFQKIIEKGISDKSNLYDIQKCCFEIGNDYKEIVDDNTLKTYAFEKGQNICIYETIFGILIRDKFFAENNLNTSDIKE